MVSTSRLTAFLSLAPSIVTAALNCRPEGPVVPRPTCLTESPIFQKDASNLTKALGAAVSGLIEAGWVVENSSFSLAVISHDQEDAGVPIWEYHHLSPENTRGTKSQDRNSQYLIGSISKVTTVYILLKSGVDLDAPVTEFLPTLDDPNSTIPWQNITLRMLASYLSGAPIDGYSEYYSLKDVYLAHGLPPMKDSDYPPCGVAGLNEACSDQQALAGMTKLYPVAPPMKRPEYSNAGFAIIGLALEKFTRKNYTRLVQEIFSDPLNLQDTFPSPVGDEKGVIPPGDSSWGADFGTNTPYLNTIASQKQGTRLIKINSAGGLVSSVADMSKFAHALLSRTLDLTTTKIEAWLKPASFAGGPNSMTGMPWEILRLSDLTPDHVHPVAVYGKNGATAAYRSQLSFVDDYGIAIVILTAGPMQAAPLLVDVMLSTFVSAVDKVSRYQAKKYERDFTSREKTDAPIKATLSQDGDSLVLSSLHRNGTDLVSGLMDLWGTIMGDFIPEILLPIRIFPTGLSTNSTFNGKPIVREVWHLRPDLMSSFNTDLPGRGLQNQNCWAWTIGDWVHHAGEPLDRMLVDMYEDGEIVGLEFPFLKSGVLVPS